MQDKIRQYKYNFYLQGLNYAKKLDSFKAVAAHKETKNCQTHGAHILILIVLEIHRCVCQSVQVESKHEPH